MHACVLNVIPFDLFSFFPFKAYGLHIFLLFSTSIVLVKVLLSAEVAKVLLVSLDSYLYSNWIFIRSNFMAACLLISAYVLLFFVFFDPLRVMWRIQFLIGSISLPPDRSFLGRIVFLFPFPPVKCTAYIVC